MFILMTYLKDQMKIYFLNFLYLLADAALGTTIEIPTIDGGKAKIKIPDGTQNGKQFRLKGKGMPL
jgi:molecular chaperone DnaJ